MPRRKDWKLLASVPLSNLPSILYGRNAPAILKCEWYTDAMRVNHKFVAGSQNTQELCNPRSTGNLGNWLFITPEIEVAIQKKQKTWIAREILYCRGLNSCTPVSDSKGKRSKCAVSVKWYIPVENKDRVNVYIRGSHGDSFGKVTKVSVDTSVRQYIKHQARLGKQPAEIKNDIEFKARHSAIDLSPDNIKFNPHIKVIQKAVNNQRFRDHKGKSDLDRVIEILEDPLYHDYIVYPREKDNYPTQEESEWVVVLSNAVLLKELATVGSEIIGLDAVFKWTKYRLPCWQVLYVNKCNTGTAAAYILADSDAAQRLQVGLQQIKAAVRQYNANWNPTVMIDMDRTERKALIDESFRFLLCEFHLSKWLTHITKSYPSETTAKVLTSMKMLQRTQQVSQVPEAIEHCKQELQAECPAFLDKVKDTLLHDLWMSGWIDAYRADLNIERWGLYNTNNFSESQFKRTSRVYLFTRQAHQMSDLMGTLLNVVLPASVIEVTTVSIHILMNV
jgi:hypothetical protein